MIDLLLVNVSEFDKISMSRISIDVTEKEHQKLKASAALQGLSIKEFVLERTIGKRSNPQEEAALQQLEALLDKRIKSAQRAGSRKRTVREIFKAERDQRG
jgi:uncharacterized protein (DUF1778 family)